MRRRGGVRRRRANSRRSSPRSCACSRTAAATSTADRGCTPRCVLRAARRSGRTRRCSRCRARIRTRDCRCSLPSRSRRSFPCCSATRVEQLAGGLCGARIRRRADHLVRRPAIMGAQARTVSALTTSGAGFVYDARVAGAVRAGDRPCIQRDSDEPSGTPPPHFLSSSPRPRRRRPPFSRSTSRMLRATAPRRRTRFSRARATGSASTRCSSPTAPRIRPGTSGLSLCLEYPRAATGDPAIANVLRRGQRRQRRAVAIVRLRCRRRDAGRRRRLHGDRGVGGVQRRLAQRRAAGQAVRRAVHASGDACRCRADRLRRDFGLGRRNVRRGRAARRLRAAHGECDGRIERRRGRTRAGDFRRASLRGRPAVCGAGGTFAGTLALGGTATAPGQAGADYTSRGTGVANAGPSVTVSFPADGATVARTVVATPIADGVAEGTETMTLTVDAGSGNYGGVGAIASATISDSAPVAGIVVEYLNTRRLPERARRTFLLLVRSGRAGRGRCRRGGPVPPYGAPVRHRRHGAGLPVLRLGGTGPELALLHRRCRRVQRAEGGAGRADADDRPAVELRAQRIPDDAGARRGRRHALVPRGHGAAAIARTTTRSRPAARRIHGIRTIASRRSSPTSRRWSPRAGATKASRSARRNRKGVRVATLTPFYGPEL